MNDLIIRESIDLTDIRYEIENINYFNNKIVPYNAKSKFPLHKFWVYIDKCKIIKKFSLNDVDHIVVALSLCSESIDHIKAIEKAINKKLIEDEITKFTIISRLSDSGNRIPSLELTVDNHTILFNENDKKLDDLKILNHQNELTILAELDCFVLSNNYLKTSWRAVQIKKIQSINLSASLFPKQEEINCITCSSSMQINTQPNISHQTTHQSTHHTNHTNHTTHQPIQQIMQQVPTQTPHTAPLQNKANQANQANQQNQQNQNQSKKPVFSIPSPQDLANALSGLKKINKGNNDNENNKGNNNTHVKHTTKQASQIMDNSIDITSISNTIGLIGGESKGLKHVKTKESNFYQMLKDEHIEKKKEITNQQLKSVNRLDELRKRSQKYYERLSYLIDKDTVLGVSSESKLNIGEEIKKNKEMCNLEVEYN